MRGDSIASRNGTVLVSSLATKVVWIDASANGDFEIKSRIAVLDKIS